jgi:hypothetical protein
MAIVGSTDARYGIPQNQVTLGTWLNIVSTWNGVFPSPTIQFYINGVLNTSTPIINTTGAGSRTSDAAQNLTFAKFGSTGSSAGDFTGSNGVLQIYNRVLSASEILTNYNALLSRYTIVTNQLVLNLDPSTYISGTTWNDSSVNGYNASLVASPTFNSAGTASSFTLNGTTQYISVPNTATLMNNMYVSGYTYSFWIKVASTSVEQVLASKEGASSWGQLMSIHQNAGATLDLLGPSAGNSLEHSYTMGSLFSANTWVNVTLSYLGGTWPTAATPANTQLFINGTEYGSTSGTSKAYLAASGSNGSDATGGTTFGYAPQTDFFTNGQLTARFTPTTFGQILVYNRQISAAEVLQNFTATRLNYGI